MTSPPPQPRPADRPELAFQRESGWALGYRDRRFSVNSGRGTDRRERRALRALLARIPDAHGPWLDAPCGAGRMSPELPGPVVQLDYAAEMLTAIEQPTGPRIRASAFALPFADHSFAGVLCHRLLHHVPTSEARVRLLRELARVSNGPLIVSFFHSFCVQHLRRWMSRKWKHKPRSSRGGVTLRTFLCDLREAGLRPVAARPLLPLWSEQWLVLAVRA